MTLDLQTWWFDPALPDCFIDGSGRSGLDVATFDRKTSAEFCHLHADYRIKNHVTEWDRTDAILALKRSMQMRMDHLNSIYNFKQYPEFKQLGPLGLLEHWGVIRQRMLRRMRQLRNAVEHEGAEPPAIDECEDYAEIVWWFLRGTSPLLMPLDNLDFNGEFHGSVTFAYDPLKIVISGDVSASLISKDERPGWVRLTTDVARYGDVTGKMTPIEIGEGDYRVEAIVADTRSAHGLLQRALRYVL
ncbi:hypothetical protein ACIQMP_21465 [Streptomyces sp. NPDC091385]|uniref:hypothetical protein n=1 Tax=Streptomyces sp. NPDC091385 TaxID=3365997 RepID=UPI0037F586B9